ncbi:Transposase ISRhOegibbosus2 [Candidatus Rhabdochlamydia oedothoracis]|uniref:Transposase ISRhOegibbosus2 n=1 Tax=Candidatus Rhabdochlamydia oedothoracis TaxID=2720720 RepID=A0ABX8UZY5_9BACT|nr:IS630 family transposase [Candidatus Rhabdochlamydia oedothoracis]QYF48471.1 Transposase ISRhOegibbosus2 [Candidatus Rhabdochlamydia oedothoracis]QYF49167.1 Transposase ISRhOegibbosus2 [Candidatus Rhabdochlamydia oedothoracis]
MKKLTPSQIADLEHKLKHPKDYSERNRLCVILGYDEGISTKNLAKALRISPITVQEYLREYDSENKTGNSPRGGSKSKLSQDQTESLLKHLQEKTYLKVKGIIAYVHEQYGIKYSRSGMTDWLIQHGFVYKRPKKIPGKLDPEKQRIFIEQYMVLKETLNPDEEIYFIDAVHPEHQSQAVCGWIKKGVQKTLQTSGKQLRLHFAGALCLTGMKIFTEEYKTVDADAMLDFFKKLEKQTEARIIHVILDNARSNKNKKLEEFLMSSRIKVHYLPPYSPNLNPIERLWKILKEKKVYNRYYETSVTFFQAIRGFFLEEIPKITDILKCRINDKFQVVDLNPIKLAV